MNEVYLAGRGLASALGPDLDTGLIALSQGGVAPSRFEFAEDLAWPLYTIAEYDPDWTARARRIALRVAEHSGALAGKRTGPLFVASSSLALYLASSSPDMSTREDGGEFHGDYQTFADTVAAWLGWRGPVFTVSTACTSCLNAMLSARTLIRNGHTDQALILGLELRNRVTLGGFGSMQLLAPTRALPFGEAREGLVLGEAVAALYVSSEPSRWRIAGGANVVDGQDPAGAVPGAIVAMCHQALVNSGREPHDIALIKLQAAGSPVNDASEVRALRQVFDPLPAMVSLKAAIGHTLSASGAAEVALLTACLETGVWPRFDYAQDALLNAPLADRTPRHVRHVLANILGFGGGHAAVVLEDRGA